MTHNNTLRFSDAEVDFLYSISERNIDDLSQDEKRSLVALLPKIANSARIVEDLIRQVEGIHESASLMIEQSLDSVEALQCELDSALDIIARRGDEGAREWLSMNYPR